jgi:hypothetical protein
MPVTDVVRAPKIPMTVLHYGRRGQTLARTLVADIASLVPNNKYSNINYL